MYLLQAYASLALPRNRRKPITLLMRCFGPALTASTAHAVSDEPCRLTSLPAELLTLVAEALDRRALLRLQQPPLRAWQRRTASCEQDCSGLWCVALCQAPACSHRGSSQAESATLRWPARIFAFRTTSSP